MAGLRTFWRFKVRCAARPAWLKLMAAAILVLGLSPAAARAQDTDPNVIDVASLTLVPLPNQSIATVKGGFLQAPGIGNSTSSSGIITLWDELKPPAPQQNNINGTSIITINGVAK